MEAFDFSQYAGWAELILALLIVVEVAVRLTPSTEDNSVVNKATNLVRNLINFLIPNRSKDGGTHS